MKKILSAALAGVIALSAVAVTASGAAAGNRGPGNWNGPGNWGNWHPKPGPHFPHRPNPGPGAFVGGAIFGLAVGALASPLFNPYPYPYAYQPVYVPPPPQPVYPVYPAYAYDSHVAWCSAQYRSYNPNTDTWVDFQGVVHVCVSP